MGNLALGDATTVLPTTPMSGAAGWVMVVIGSPPNGFLRWGVAGSQGQVWVKDDSNDLKVLQGTSLGGNVTMDWLTPGGKAIFYVIPVDASGKLFAPVAQAVVSGAAGIYASAGTPQSEIDNAKAFGSHYNVVLQVYTSTDPAPVSDPTPPDPTKSDPTKTTPPATDALAFLDAWPGGRYLYLLGGALLAYVMFTKKQ